MLLIKLNNELDIPEQIQNQIESFIEDGLLKANDPLPSVRQLGKDLNINPNTVLKAYKLLEKEKYIYCINKKGFYVYEYKHAKQNADLYSIISYIRNEGISKKQLKQIIDEVYLK